MSVVKIGVRNSVTERKKRRRNTDHLLAVFATIMMKVKVLVAQSCPGYLFAWNSFHGILQARILEWVAGSLLQGIFPTQGLKLDLLP